jgi:hypothetical protein
MIREVNQASSINRDAGSYPITDDPVELEAAARASERSFAEFPYYEARFGERGRRFGNSDGAWLALLAHHEQAEIDRQVLWLGRVLAARGMPQLLLERYLEILHDELATQLPVRRERYDKLLRAAAMLREERQELLGDDELAALAREFDAAVGPEWSARLPRMGEILVSAVVDERLGIPEAVTSLEGWMTEAERFPPSWIEAARRTIEAARAATP